MARTKTTPATDVHGKPIEDGIYQSTDSWVMALPDGREVGARRGDQLRHDSVAVQAAAYRFKRIGDDDPPPAWATATVWQPDPPKKPAPNDFLVCARRVVGPSAGGFHLIEPGQRVHRHNPVAVDYADNFRPLTDDEAADLAAAIEAAT